MPWAKMNFMNSLNFHGSSKPTLYSIFLYTYSVYVPGTTCFQAIEVSGCPFQVSGVQSVIFLRVALVSIAGVQGAIFVGLHQSCSWRPPNLVSVPAPAFCSTGWDLDYT